MKSYLLYVVSAATWLSNATSLHKLSDGTMTKNMYNFKNSKQIRRILKKELWVNCKLCVKICTSHCALKISLELSQSALNSKCKKKSITTSCKCSSEINKKKSISR